VVRRLDAGRLLLPKGTASNAERAETGGVFDSEVHAVLSKASSEKPLWWVVDDADILAMGLSSAAIQDLAKATAAGCLRVAWCRNRYIDEAHGSATAHEAPLTALLRRHHLTPLGLAEAHSLALRFYENYPDGSQRADWLVSWAGGWPSLMRALKPHAPKWPKPSQPSKGMHWLATAQIEDFGLAQGRRPALLKAALEGLLPPQALVGPSDAREIGYLVAIGLLPTDYVNVRSTLAAPFWRFAIQQCLLKEASCPPRPTRNDDWGLRLASACETLGFARDLVDVWGLAEEKSWDDVSDSACLLLAEGLSRAHGWHSEEPLRPLQRALATALGRIGLRSVLRALGQGADRGSANDLAQRVLSGSTES